MNYVSIPFKRESPFGQTTTYPIFSTWSTSFNSLQTGKSFWTQRKARTARNKKRVSIPFKRESPFGHCSPCDNFDICPWFQFPSNGKVLSDSSIW